MKVIALSCSPSRGRNSDTMLDHFIAGASQVKDIEVEKVYLEDITIDYYNHKNSKGVLPHEQDFGDLAQKLMTNTRGLVIATPTYNFSVPAHLKNFIDRMRFFGLDMANKNKLGQPVGQLDHLSTYFIVSGGTPNWARRILFFTFPSFWLRGVFLYFGAKVYGAIYSGDIHTQNNKKVLRRCEKAGEKYAKKLLKGSQHGALEQIFWRPPQVR
ncbi:MAG: FMN-dependent NADH-azoreductase [Candidatus Paceibacteria bacterium]|jgi:FMN-dependent NADH-azoreductase